MKTAAPNDKGQEEFVGIDVGKARPMNLEAVPRIQGTLMKVVVAAVLSILVGSDLSYAQAFSHLEKSKLMPPSEAGEVAIDLANSILRRNSTYTIRYTFRALNSYEVYNWQFNRLKPLPGQLVIYDKNKKYIGDLIAFSGGSRSRISDQDWTFLYGGAFVGTSLTFRAGFVPNTAFDTGSNLLPVGTYYIQLVLYRAFLSPNPFRASGDRIDFYKTFDRSEQYRSNTIRIEIVAQ